MFTAQKIESLIQAQSKRAHELVKKAADRMSSAGFAASTSVREGDAKSIILESAAEWETEIVVVGSHGRKGITRFVLGSVSEAVARYARCSVEIARCVTYSRQSGQEWPYI
jgi:nucleotide-binding universal stress UspA family protein